MIKKMQRDETECNPLTAKQIKAAFHLSNGEDVATAASWAGVSRVTLWRWRQLPEFKAIYLDEREKADRELRERTEHKLTHLAYEAISALWSELHHSGAQRLHAAQIALKLLGIERIDVPGIPVQNTVSNAALSAASTSVIEAETPSALSDVTP